MFGRFSSSSFHCCLPATHQLNFRARNVHLVVVGGEISSYEIGTLSRHSIIISKQWGSCKQTVPGLGITKRSIYVEIVSVKLAEANKPL